MKNRLFFNRVGWRDFLAASVFILSFLCFYRLIIFENSTIVFVDASRFFYPVWKWGADVVHGGFIPLWNSNAQFGTPYLADPQMAYVYPPVFLIYSLVNPTNAFVYLVILHHFWAVIGFWFFVRRQGFSMGASLAGSFIFGFSLQVVCSSWTPVATLTISWIPWILWAIEKVLQSEKRGWVWLSFVWAMQFAAGYPVLTYLTALAVLFHLIWRFFLQPDPVKRFVGISCQIILAGLIAITYNLAWGLPFLELFRLSNYEAGAGRYHDLGWLDLGTVLNPFIQGHPMGPSYHGPHYWVSTYFMGLPPLCLIVWGVTRRLYQKTSWGVGIVLFVLSLGVLGLGKVLKTFVPGYSLVIHSGYWISLLVFWAAWLSVESADSLLNQNWKIREWSKVFGNGWRPWIEILLLIYLGAVVLGQQLMFLPFWLSLLCLVLFLFLKRRTVRCWLLVISIILSIGPAADSLNLLLDRSYNSMVPKILSRTNQEGRLFFSPPMLREAGRLQGENVYSAYQMAKEKLYPNWPLVFGKEEASFYNTLQLKNSYVWTDRPFGYSLNFSRRVLDYLNIRYVFGKNTLSGFRKVAELPKPIPLPKVGVKPIMAHGFAVEVSENLTSLPKWFSVERAIAAGSALEDDLQKADKENLDLGKVCFVEDSTKAGSYQRRQVTVQTRWPNRLALTAEGKGRALVISSETAYPGWKAYVEGKEKPLEVINHAFRGLILEDGESRVVLQFEPLSFRLGLFLSLLVCGFWAGLALKGLKP